MENAKSETQAVIFFKFSESPNSKRKWEVSTAMKWLIKHNLNNYQSLHDLHKNQIRVRMTDPRKYKYCTSKKLMKDGKYLYINLIIGWL